jgi:hypothetical protein
MASIQHQLTEAEGRLAEASSRFDRMHAGNPEFFALGSAVSKLQERTAELRQCVTDERYGVADVEAPSSVDEKISRAVQRTISAISAGVGDVVGREFSAIKKRLASLEGAPVVKYAGIFDRTRTYAPGSMVTFKGSTWHANMQVKGVEPGDGASWTLAVKRGRDART